MKGLVDSTLLWICALIVVASAAMTLIPIDLLKEGDLCGKTLRFQSTADKLGTYFSSGMPADILLIGSSLFLYPAIRCDDALDNRPTRYDESYVIKNISTYQSARYFEKRLQEETHQPISVANLSTAGSTISDQYHVFRKVCTSGKKPKLLICDISPREFFDHTLSEPAKTPVYSKIVDWNCLGDLFDSKHNTEAVGQCMLGYVWNSYRERATMRNLAVNSAAWLTGHPVDLQGAVDDAQHNQQESKSLQNYLKKLLPSQKTSKPIYKQPNILAEDLKHYQFMYSPIEQTMIDTQFVYLERLLSDAKRENVPVCLVQMPLSEPNLQLLPEKVRESIFSKAKVLAQKYSAKYCTPESLVTFTASDFEDSAHLNAAGGRKLFDALTTETTQLQSWLPKSGNSKVADAIRPI
ncbi:MAG: hypothetical protein C0469_18115 [Cyanobacteria bacterium DS2.3.42]|nr:hypothetical protein [Cyanobacteria bacterium DS2.3.42]